MRSVKMEAEGVSKLEERIFCVDMRQEKLPNKVTKVQLIHVESPIEYSGFNRVHRQVFLEIHHQ